ncbi:unnamed protein product [Amoebophrya sp. A25]|nr:unnamed protein product [Amoebophrya sp. A25]|eukprot:GSA25T00002130001.1
MHGAWRETMEWSSFLVSGTDDGLLSFVLRQSGASYNEGGPYEHLRHNDGQVACFGCSDCLGDVLDVVADHCRSRIFFSRDPVEVALFSETGEFAHGTPLDGGVEVFRRATFLRVEAPTRQLNMAVHVVPEPPPPSQFVDGYPAEESDGAVEFGGPKIGAYQQVAVAQEQKPYHHQFGGPLLDSARGRVPPGMNGGVPQRYEQYNFEATPDTGVPIETPPGGKGQQQHIMDQGGSSSSSSYVHHPTPQEYGMSGGAGGGFSQHLPPLPAGPHVSAMSMMSGMQTVVFYFTIL